MQEQLQYKMTPHQGWAQMEPILDKAMPIDSRSRRLIGFWWSAAAVVTMAIISTLLFSGNPQWSSPAVATSPSIENPEASQDNSANNSKFQVPPANQGIVKNAPEPKSDSTIPIVDNSEKKNPSAANHAPLEQNHVMPGIAPASGTKDIAAIETDQPSSGDLKGKNAITFSQNDSDPSTILNASEEVVGSVEIASQEFQDRDPRMTDFLPLPEMFIDAFTSNDIASIEPTIIKRNGNTRNLIEPYLAIGGTLGIKNGIGVDAGAGLNVNLDSRLSLVAGMNYQTYRPDVVVFGNFKSFNQNAESEALLAYDARLGNSGFYIPAEAFQSVVSNEAIIPFIQSITMWQFTGGLKYDVTRRFSVESGFSFGFGTRAISQYPIIAFDYLGSPDINSNVSNSFDRSVIRSNMKSVYLGFAYGLGKHFDLYARYTHGLDQFLIADSAGTLALSSGAEYVRGINVGMRYAFGGP